MSGEARARQSASQVCSARNVSRLVVRIDDTKGCGEREKNGEGNTR